jgi:hypothetical protein
MLVSLHCNVITSAATSEANDKMTAHRVVGVVTDIRELLKTNARKPEEGK